MLTAPPPFAAVITSAVVAIAFGAMLLLERRRPLRVEREPKLTRVARNLTIGAIALGITTLLQIPILIPLSQWVMANRIGLLNQFGLSTTTHVILGVLLLDYTLWWWHWANHRVPFLWRFHLVHHVDRDLDASTALRFHFGEHTLSMLYRGAQIAILGASPLAVWTWQLILFVSILFHHSNVELPVAWERRIVRFFVTPRMHGIHHSDRFSETDSNWSSLLSWWDYLHRTLVLNVAQREVVIGVPAYQTPEDVTLGRALAIPFARQRRDFHEPDGTLRTRAHDRDVAALSA